MRPGMDLLHSSEGDGPSHAHHELQMMGAPLTTFQLTNRPEDVLMIVHQPSERIRRGGLIERSIVDPITGGVVDGSEPLSGSCFWGSNRSIPCNLH